MCGIAGVLAFDRQTEISERKLKLMTDSLSHRGPDGEGQYISDDGIIGLGHRRLSILDLSEHGAQPMELRDSDRYQITFNGEIYNYLEIRKRLQDQGVQFFTDSDTEVLLRLYAIKGEKCLDELDGMFAFAIWDHEKQELFCARDRFGEKPFYYSLNDKRLVFSSEMKAIFAFDQTPEINEQRVFDYLHHGYVLDRYDGNSTFYRDIVELEPAHFLVVQHNRNLRKQAYWNLDLSHKTTNISLESASARFAELFDISIKTRLRSDVPVGSSLSGGLDSSSIVATIDKFKSENQLQQTFSARFKGHHKDEGEYIDAISAHVGVDGHMIWPDASGFIESLDSHFYFQEEPYQHSSVFAQHEVMRLAKENNVTVLLDGQGADEILAGYHGYFNTFLKELYLGNRDDYRQQKEGLENNYRRSFGFGLGKKMAYLFPGITRPLSAIKQSLKPPDYTRNTKLSSDFFESYYRPNAMTSPSSLNEALLASITKSSLPKLLRYGDRNSMANSREVRLPFLNHELVEFVFSLPSTLLINSGWTKYILRESMKERLPEKITWRKDKIGYEPPQEQWMNSPVIGELKMEAIEFLKGKKMIREGISSDTWQYIMIYKLYNTFK